MKQIIVTVALILLAVFIFALIMGDTGSLKAMTEGFFIEMSTQFDGMIQ